MAPATWTSASRRNLVIAAMTLGIPPKSKISCLLQGPGWSKRKLVPKKWENRTFFLGGGGYDLLQTLPGRHKTPQNNNNKKQEKLEWHWIFWFGRTFFAWDMFWSDVFGASGWCQSGYITIFTLNSLETQKSDVSSHLEWMSKLSTK